MGRQAMASEVVHRSVEDHLYRPLSAENKEIRILQIENGRSPNTQQFANASKPRSPSVLSFTLGKISLADRIAPFFDAISYTRGPYIGPEETATVIINGHPLDIPKSVEEALWAVCVRHGHYRVWIDAVCMDQEDTYERNNQVAIMGDIYSKATRVVVWLGEDTANKEPAIGSVEKLLDTLNPPSLERTKTPHSSSSRSPPLSTDPRKFAMFNRWSSVYSFFTNRWFTRAWVIQEVCLAKQALFYQGHYHKAVDFWDIARVGTHLFERRHTLPKSPERNALVGIENTSTIHTLKRHKAQSLATLLRVVYTFNCYDPHDMVYSILGLRHKSGQRPESETRIIPIYEEPILETYAKATKAAIADTRSLGILKHAHSLRPLSRKNGSKDDDFPSWALRMDQRGHYHINPISYRHFRFNADNHIPLVLWANDSSRVLRVQGILIDTICEVSETMVWKQYGEENDTLTAAAVLHETYSWARELLPLVSPENMSRRFSITVAAGQDASGRNLSEAQENASRLHHGFMTIAHANDHSPNIPGTSTMTGKASPEDSDADDNVSLHSVSTTGSRSIDVTDFDTDLAADNPDATYALSAMMKGGHHRTVFVTDKKALMGLGTDNVQPGDAVCVLFGGSVPFVLRPRNHYWHFVGDTFVEGLMQGEWIRDMQDQGRLDQAKQWFKIR